MSTTIRSDRPIMLEITGQSFGSEKHIVSLDGKCTFDEETNSILVLEAGRVMVKVSEKPVIEKEGRLMYDGMTGVLSATKPLQEVELFEVRLHHDYQCRCDLACVDTSSAFLWRVMGPLCHGLWTMTKPLLSKQYRRSSLILCAT